MIPDRLHAGAVDLLKNWEAPDAEQDRLRSSYVDHLRRHPDGLWRTCFPAHLTAGTLVTDLEGRHVLLNLHRKAKRWFAFGGHLEPGDVSLADAALREAQEESGLGVLRLEPEPVHLSAHPVEFCDPRGTVTHLDVRFLARVPFATPPVVSLESLEVRWWPVTALPTEEPDMLELIRLALSRTR